MVHRFFERIEKVEVWMNTIFVFLACLMMTALVVVVCSDVFLRYFLRSPLVWSTEVTEILLLDITFLGAAWVLKENGHVVIDVFTAKVAGSTKKVLSFISYALIAIVGIVLVYYGFFTTIDHWIRGIYNPTAIETPIWLILLVIPLGSIPLLMEIAVKFWKLFKR